MSYADKAIDAATGRLRSYAEVTAGQEAARHAARTAQILADQQTEAGKPETLRRIELYDRQIAEARHNGDRDREAMYREKRQDLREQYATEQAAEKKAAIFAADPRVALLRERADILERSGSRLYPNSPNELGMLIAIARSNDFPTVDAMYAEFQTIADRLDDEAHAAASKAERDKAVAVAKAGMEHAEARVLVSEIEANRQARQVVNGQ